MPPSLLMGYLWQTKKKKMYQNASVEVLLTYFPAERKKQKLKQNQQIFYGVYIWKYFWIIIRVPDIETVIEINLLTESKSINKQTNKNKNAYQGRENEEQ